MSIQRILWGLRVMIFRIIVFIIVISTIEHFTHTSDQAPRVETMPMANVRNSDTYNNTNVPGHKSPANALSGLSGSEPHSTSGMPTKRSGGQKMAEQAVIVSFQYSGKTLDDLYTLEDKLTRAIHSAGAGEFDGDEIATDGSHGTLYLYGPDADALFLVVKPLLSASTSLVKPVATIRYGPAGHGARERVVNL
jgi:hypothetical protein